jgi:hypothetical protein
MTTSTARGRGQRATGNPRTDRAQASGKASGDKDSTSAPGPQNGKATIARLRREIDRAIIQAAGELVARVPAAHRKEVAQLISNQLHHLATKADGWPSDKLPAPARSDWR